MKPGLCWVYAPELLKQGSNEREQSSTGRHMLRPDE
jgi:hypothetical protein